MTISREERAAIREQHHQFVDDAGKGWGCSYCDHDWPCTSVRLLDALEAAERAQLIHPDSERGLGPTGTYCRRCGTTVGDVAPYTMRFVPAGATCARVTR